MVNEKTVEIVSRFLSELEIEKFTGKVEINFFKGGIADIKQQKTIKLHELAQE